MNEQNPFFARKLLRRLETESPMEIAFESQVKSAEVGFDFATASLAFDRLADEMRELSEALGKFEGGEDSIEHLCDEATDVIFGTINVLRHAKLDINKVFPRLNTAPSQRTESSSRQLLLEKVNSAFQDFKEAFLSFEVESSAGLLLEPAVVLMQRAINFVNACDVHSDEVMKRNVNKYLIRCQFIEDQLQGQNKTWRDISLDEIYKRWKQAKQAGL